MRAYVGLGSNLGDRRKMIDAALASMGQLPGTRVMKVSSIQETQPIGPIRKQAAFLNAVAALETLFGPLDLLDALLGIERRLGRVREKRWGPRVIDLDILLYGDHRIDHPRLRVPHPEIRYRPFVLEGLSEVGACVGSV